MLSLQAGKIILPAEVSLMIIEHLVLPQTPCINHFFCKEWENCIDPWACKYAHPRAGSNGSLVCTPDRRIASVNHVWMHEAYRYFFRNHIFIFTNSRERIWSNSLDSSGFFHSFRDPKATRLLNYIDVPVWQKLMSAMSRGNSSYAHVDNYRHLIRHLVLGDRNIKQVNSVEMDFIPWDDWDWPLQVDFSSLPDLQTLYLDLRGYSTRERPWDEDLNRIHNRLTEGVTRMHCLNLKKLVVAGLCSNHWYEDKEHRESIKNLFQPALGTDGVFELLDVEEYREW